MKKLSEQLMDAYMSGDKDLINTIKSQINTRYAIKRDEKVIQINTILNDDKASPVLVYNFIKKNIGDDWHDLEIETIERLLFVKYAVALEDVNRDKILAIRHVCRSDRFLYDWFEFNQVALSFSGSIADFECLRTPSPGMVINAVKSIRHIKQDVDFEFGDEVIKYICIIMIDNGIYVPPPSLIEIAKDEMKGMVSKEMFSKWGDILKRFVKILKDDNATIIEDDSVDIIARRMITAEAAALKYGA
jgi:hypothetical protein